MQKIAVLADSGCQLPVHQLEEQGIFIAPLTITIEEKSYLDQIEIDSLTVFKRMEKDDVMVMTSQPSIGVLQETVQRIKDAGYEHIIALPIATGLSSTLNGMKLACDMIGIEVTLIDTKGTARNHKELIETASKLIQQGKSIDEIRAVLEDMIDHSGTIIMVPNLDHLKKGGRITPAVAMLAGLLKIVPVMKLNYELGGKIDTLDKVRTVKKANLKIIQHMVEECHVNAKDYVFAIEHVLSEELALEMKQRLIDTIGECDIIVRELPAVVGAHMGIGGIGYQFIKKYED
ncbi:MAG: DegV family protein [Faecalibacillus sp.]